MYFRYVITKDNVMTSINAIMYYQIMGPVKAMYEIANLPDTINTKLRDVLDDVTNNYSSDISHANYMLAEKYINALERMTSGKDTRTVYMPYYASAMLNSGKHPRCLSKILKTGINIQHSICTPLSGYTGRQTVWPPNPDCQRYGTSLS